MISTALLSKSTIVPADPIVSQPMADEVAKNEVRMPVLDPIPPVQEEIKRGGSRRISDVSKEDLDAGLGLLDHVLETDDNYQVPGTSLLFVFVVFCFRGWSVTFGYFLGRFGYQRFNRGLRRR